MKETDLQFHIKSSVIKDGGYSKKLSNRFTIGIPDLVIILPPFAPCFAEVKELGECVEDFDRQIGVTDKQTHELNKMSAPYTKPSGVNGILITPAVSLILVGLVWQGERRLVPLPRGSERLSAGLMADRTSLGKRGVGNYYNVRELLEFTNIARMA